ncbi:hypothetical protein [Microbulbifer aggregans]|uniref:hypothetical protein n=1 Tax=Microbulbifer aggregans TaxID=1769779 RepID=UPI001CFE0A2C|nr:hypothetical protein [Microbulbifer aggregans]
MLKKDLQRCKFSVLDEKRVENFTFSGEIICATIGMKNGPVCAPVLKYEITGSDSLVIDKEDFNIQWTNIEFKGNTLSVVRNGVPTEYKILPS